MKHRQNALKTKPGRCFLGSTVRGRPEVCLRVDDALAPRQPDARGRRAAAVPRRAHSQHLVLLVLSYQGEGSGTQENIDTQYMIMCSSTQNYNHS